jgi:hypothetical protein
MGLRGQKPWQPRDGDEPVAMLGPQGDWTLWHRPSRCSGDWHSFVLQPPTDLRKTKSVHYGGWNGERLARTYDMGVLANKNPDVYAQLETECPRLDWDHDP